MDIQRAHGRHRNRTRRARGWKCRGKPSGLMVCVAAVWLALGITGCQANGRRHASIREFALTKRAATIDLTFRHRDHDRQPFSGANNQERFQETVFEETLRLRSEGYVYHPTLLEFVVGAAFGLRQAEFEEETSEGRISSSSDGEVLEFDVSGMFLKRKSYPTSFYARRSRRLEPRPFRSSLEAVSTGYGVTWQFVSTKTPIRLQFDHNETDLDPFLRAGDVEGRRESTNLTFETGYIFGKHNRLSFLFTHESIEEEPLDFQFDRDEVRLTHLYEFGEEHQHRLESEVRHMQQSGTFDNERTEWRESLVLQHDDRLRTSYDFSISERKQNSVFGSESINEDAYRGSVTLEHRLYDNLESVFSGHFQNQDFDTGLEIRRWGLGAGFRYYRHNTWGLFRAAYRVRADWQDVGGGEQGFEVIDEERIFRDPEPIVLSSLNIELSSIRLLSEDRTELYVQGEDYRLRPIGDRVEIERVVTGRISDGETVLISYRFRIGGSYELNTLTQTLDVRQELKSGLTPYYRLRNQEQKLEPSSATGVTPEDLTSHLLGAEYRRGDLRLTAEYENYESTISPFVAVRLSGHYNHKFSDGSSGSVGAQWSDVDGHGLQPRRKRLLALEGRYQRHLARDMRIEGGIAYRREDDTLSGGDEGYEVDLGFDWQIRKTQLRIDYRYTDYRDDFAEQDSSTLFVRVRRRL